MLLLQWIQIISLALQEKKNYSYALVYFPEDKTLVRIKTSAIEEYDSSFIAEGDNVIVAWRVGKFSTNHEAKVLYFRSKYTPYYYFSLYIIGYEATNKYFSKNDASIAFNLIRSRFSINKNLKWGNFHM